jgi:ABC-type polar amino acid transport system ATPase subunit
MEEFGDRYPNKVSASQRQLAAICRAICLKPRCLLLDEVTSALDVEYVALLLRKLKELRASGTSVLVITHLLRFASESADRVLFMDRGEIVEQGDSSILRHPSSERLADFVACLSEAS